MGLVVSAQVIRELIADGDYIVECIEQREQGKVAVAFALRSRAQPYTVQIETMDKRLDGLFHALLDVKPSPRAQPAFSRVGGQPVPVVEVESVPADTPKGHRRASRKSHSTSKGKEAIRSPAPRRSPAGQLILMPQEPSHQPIASPASSKRRRAARGEHSS